MDPHRRDKSVTRMFVALGRTRWPCCSRAVYACRTDHGNGFVPADFTAKQATITRLAVLCTQERSLRGNQSRHRGDNEPPDLLLSCTVTRSACHESLVPSLVPPVDYTACSSFHSLVQPRRLQLLLSMPILMPSSRACNSFSFDITLACAIIVHYHG